eukprot:31218-Pelagococcus_subviridis.AAC.3
MPLHAEVIARVRAAPRRDLRPARAPHRGELPRAAAQPARARRDHRDVVVHPFEEEEEDERRRDEEIEAYGVPQRAEDEVRRLRVRRRRRRGGGWEGRERGGLHEEEPRGAARRRSAAQIRRRSGRRRNSRSRCKYYDESVLRPPGHASHLVLRLRVVPALVVRVLPVRAARRRLLLELDRRELGEVRPRAAPFASPLLPFVAPVAPVVAAALRVLLRPALRRLLLLPVHARRQRHDAPLQVRDPRVVKLGLLILRPSKVKPARRPPPTKRLGAVPQPAAPVRVLVLAVPVPEALVRRLVREHQVRVEARHYP